MLKKPAFLSPRKTEETNNWEEIFDGPQHGLIVLIRSAKSVKGLQESSLLIINFLYARNNDQVKVARYTGELELLISNVGVDGDLTRVKEGVVVMLERIKAERIQKARLFAEQANQRTTSNRRLSSSFIKKLRPLFNLSRPLFNLFRSLFNLFKRIKLVPTTLSGAVAMGAAACVLTASILFGDQITNQLEVRLAAFKTPGTGSGSALGDGNQTMPPAIVLPDVLVYRGIDGRGKKFKQLTPIFVLENRRVMAHICRQRPKIIDKINLYLDKENQLTTPNRNSANLTSLASGVRKLINTQFSEITLSKVLLVDGVKYSDRVSLSENCHLASSRYITYIYPPEH